MSADLTALRDSLRAALEPAFDVDELIGSGSLGPVYGGSERESGRRVAIRAVPPDAPEGFGERLRREARVAANLVHPGIVRVLKLGAAPPADWYAMERVDGLPLAGILAREGALPIPVVLLVLRALADALAYAHGRHVLHRDVRGASIFVGTEGQVVLADTGIARALRERGAALAGTRSAAFASPEVCAGEEPTERSDQYALGVLAFQMLAGRLPFEADSVEALLERHRSAQPPDIEALRRDAPPAILTVVRRAMSKDAAGRYASTPELLAAVQEAYLPEEERGWAVTKLAQFAARAPARAPETPAPPPPRQPRPTGRLVPLAAPPPAPISWEPAAPVAAPSPPAPAAGATTGPPASSPEPPPALAPAPPPSPAPAPAPTAAPSPPPGRPSRPTPSPDAWGSTSPAEARERRSGAIERPPERLSRPSIQRSEVVDARRSARLAGILAPVLLLGVVALAGVFVARRVVRGPAVPQRVADSLRAVARAESIATYAPVQTMGWVRLDGDIPDDAAITLDQNRVRGTIFTAWPGRHTLRIRTADFDPWETRIRVTAGDTLTVEVELALRQPRD